MIIAIDGPAAAGKGTLARRIAHALGLPYLDTGLLYRAVAVRVLEASGDPADAETATRAALALRQEDLARPDLRGAAADRAASQVAGIPAVRAALLDYQRAFGGARGAVLDGRDIGTVVFPDARIKLYVTASVPARARRRHAELLSRGEPADLAAVTAELESRDRADAGRKTAPMRAAPDARTLDTTDLDADAALAAALAIIRSTADGG